MKSLKTTSRIFYGVGIVGIGLLHFFYKGFRPVILPVPPEVTQNLSVLIYLTGALLVAGGLCVIADYKTKMIAVLLGIFLLMFDLFGHLPNRLKYMPDVLGAWTDALKLLAISGGAFIVARTSEQTETSRLTYNLNKLTFLGRYFFGLMLLIFGIDHFLYTDFVASLVPTWIPSAKFWTYFAGVALIGSGLAFIIKFQIKTISILTGLMLLLWLFLLHIPRAAVADNSKDPNEIVSVFECLAFSGIAFLLRFE